MKYQSTRDSSLSLSFKEVVSLGLSSDGGLFLPHHFPSQKGKLEGWSKLSYAELSAQIYSIYCGESIPSAKLPSLLGKSLSKFRSPEITPLVSFGEANILELFHGPTWSFKDIALQTLGNLFEMWPGEKGFRTVLGATSGDTGSAAIHGLMGKANIKTYILFPEGRVSPIQEKQMTTIRDDGVHCLAVKGSFDDCQKIVKELFGDADFKNEVCLSAVNSINWARILSQIVYYFYGYFRWVEKEGKTMGDELPCCVPTGNFGDIFAGYVAKQMGLPLSPLIIASNENDILTRFHQSGVYATTEVVPTSSPSMDIQLSSNFERLLYLLLGRDDKKLSELMSDLNTQGSFSVSPEVQQIFCAEFKAEKLSESECEATIRKYQSKYSYTIDPHTAVGLGVAEKVLGEGVSFMSLSTAHPAKFLGAVEKATGKSFTLPDELNKLAGMKGQKEIIENNSEAVKAFILETS